MYPLLAITTDCVISYAMPLQGRKNRLDPIEMLYSWHPFFHDRKCPWENFKIRWHSFVYILPWLHDITICSNKVSLFRIQLKQQLVTWTEFFAPKLLTTTLNSLVLARIRSQRRLDFFCMILLIVILNLSPPFKANSHSPLTRNHRFNIKVVLFNLS